LPTNRKNGFVEIKPHWQTKHRILGKYLNACLTFQQKYNNFAYVDSHGGSGKVLLDGKQVDGSPLIAAKQLRNFPCHITEIDAESFQRLRESANGISNIYPQNGDCNVLVPEIISKIESWKFCLCFVDPDGLVYHKGSQKFMQLTSQTIDSIANSVANSGPKTELLLNFQAISILRTMGFVEKLPEDDRTPIMAEDITALYGCEDWESARTRRELLDIFIDRRLKPFEYKGTFLVEDNGHPLYYLVYASHNIVGARIMKDIMGREYGQLLLEDYPLERFYFDN
jgi:three-Cys-motif partner protein